MKLYNTATRTRETFEPLEPGRVGMYVCGVTVYDLCHIGHARSAIVFDVLSRYLRARGFQVTYVRNFTDVDDKIINRAREMQRDPADLAEEFIKAFHEDMGMLGVGPADHEPRATEHIDGMIEMIRTLLEKGIAYEAEGDVFYAVEAFPGYGALSGRKMEDLQAGSRVAVDAKKRNPHDFALWKAAKPGEPQWESPWGPGRPGWHMECSVMSSHFLGNTFDIHGGGRDLLFPHHENERAQSIAANGGSFARYWVHNGFVTVEGEKMSKSLGNFLTIRDAIKSYHPEVLRLFLLSKHYRTPLDFSREAVADLQSGLLRIYRTLGRLEETLGSPARVSNTPALLRKPAEGGFLGEFVRVMDDDMNTAGAVGLLFDKVREINRLLDEGAEQGRVGLERDDLMAAASVLGLLRESPRQFELRVAGDSKGLDDERIEEMIRQRAEARKAKDWKTADAIRDRLKEMGVVLEDGPGGTTWRPDV